MDRLDISHNHQTPPLSPSWNPLSPKSYHQIMDILDDPVVETQNSDNDSTPPINETNPLPQPTLISLRESLTTVQNPPDMQQQQQPYCNSHEFFKQSDQEDILTPEMVRSILELDVSTMHQPQLVCNSSGYLQQSDQQASLNPHMLTSHQVPNASTMYQQQQQLLCNSQGNLPNSGSDELLNPNGINSFQDPNNTTMINIGQQMEEENGGYVAHSTMIPNNLQQKFNASVTLPPNNQSYPTYQHGPVASHFNQQQPPPQVLANRGDGALVSVTGTEMARSYRPHNQTSMTSYLAQMPSSSSRTYPLQNQISMTTSVSQPPSSSTRTYRPQNRTSSGSQMPSNLTRANPGQNQIPVQPQMQSNPTRGDGNVQVLIDQPPQTFTNPQALTFVPIRPRLTSFPPVPNPIQGSFLGRRRRYYQSQFVRGELASAAQRRRVVSQAAPNPGEERLENKVYDPYHESLGLHIDPHLRNLSMYL